MVGAALEGEAGRSGAERQLGTGGRGRCGGGGGGAVHLDVVLRLRPPRRRRVGGGLEWFGGRLGGGRNLAPSSPKVGVGRGGNGGGSARVSGGDWSLVRFEEKVNQITQNAQAWLHDELNKTDLRLGDENRVSVAEGTEGQSYVHKTKMSLSFFSIRSVP